MLHSFMSDSFTFMHTGHFHCGPPRAAPPPGGAAGAASAVMGFIQTGHSVEPIGISAFAQRMQAVMNPPPPPAGAAGSARRGRGGTTGGTTGGGFAAGLGYPQSVHWGSMLPLSKLHCAHSHVAIATLLEMK